MKKTKQLNIKKLSLSKKTISFLDTKSSEQVVGGWTQSDIYAGCVTGGCTYPTNGCVTIGYGCVYQTAWNTCHTCNCPIQTDPYRYC